jgi:hypothetical protein
LRQRLTACENGPRHREHFQKGTMHCVTRTNPAGANLTWFAPGRYRPHA